VEHFCLLFSFFLLCANALQKQNSKQVTIIKLVFFF
jgi:hypothetical protein